MYYKINCYFINFGFSDFDEDELEQLAGSGGEEGEKEEESGEEEEEESGEEEEEDDSEEEEMPKKKRKLKEDEEEDVEGDVSGPEDIVEDFKFSDEESE